MAAELPKPDRPVNSAGRTDLVIALCALIVSTLTAGAVIYQGKLLASQLSVTVWP